MYHSIVIEESLTNVETFKKFKIIRTKFSTKENWHLHIVKVDGFIEEFISTIQSTMVSDRPFYFHCYDEGNTLRVIFKDKIFDINPNDKSTWKEVSTYGARKLNIPTDQLDFYPSRISEEEDWYNKK
jgi:hypothetical protein